jgi:hypothetical protein
MTNPFIGPNRTRYVDVQLFTNKGITPLTATDISSIQEGISQPEPEMIAWGGNGDTKNRQYIIETTSVSEKGIRHYKCESNYGWAVVEINDAEYSRVVEDHNENGGKFVPGCNDNTEERKRRDHDDFVAQDTQSVFAWHKPRDLPDDYIEKRKVCLNL